MISLVGNISREGTHVLFYRSARIHRISGKRCSSRTDACSTGHGGSGSKANPDEVHVIRRRWGCSCCRPVATITTISNGRYVIATRWRCQTGARNLQGRFAGHCAELRRHTGRAGERRRLTCTDELNYELWVNSGGAEKNRPPDFPRVPIDGSATKSVPGMILFSRGPQKTGTTWRTTPTRSRSARIVAVVPCAANHGPSGTRCSPLT